MFDKLLERSKNGDKKALEEIIERLQPLLVSSIRRYYNKADQYDDLMQEGNMKIIESVNDFDRNRGVYFLGYIKLNIKYLYLDKHKQKFHQSLNQKSEDGQTEMMDLLVDDEVDFLGGMIEGEERIEIKRALSLLTPRQRLVLALFYGGDMSIGEIADDLGVAYRTIINTKIKALEKMRKALKSYRFDL